MSLRLAMSSSIQTELRSLQTTPRMLSPRKVVSAAGSIPYECTGRVERATASESSLDLRLDLWLGRRATALGHTVCFVVVH